MFTNNLWPVDLFTAMIFSLFIGWFSQKAVDSGEYFPERIALSILIAISSYLLACIFPLLLNQNLLLPSWFWLGVVGSFIYSFNSVIIYFIVTNIDSSETTPILEQIFSLFYMQIDNFVIVGLGLSFILTTIMIVVRLIRVGIETIGDLEH
jgi:hypothetical protein